jgi:hypothetical protein
MEIIGLSGYARCGKDSTAAVLVKEFGFKRVAFADKLREVLLALDPIVAPSKELYFTHSKTVVNLSEVIDVYGWSGYKETDFGPEIRRLLQRLGTEAGRQTLWDSIWVDAALTRHDEDAKLVVTDCRFPNEAEAVTSRGGVMWRIMRQGVGPANTHASETSLDDWDFDAYVHNDGTLADLAGSVKRRYLERLGTKV